jgi:hypothetical protein
MLKANDKEHEDKAVGISWYKKIKVAQKSETITTRLKKKLAKNCGEHFVGVSIFFVFVFWPWKWTQWFAFTHSLA